MPLCTRCKSEATTHTRDGSTAGGGPRPHTEPPHGLSWGESCDRCELTAEVSF